MMTRLSKYAGVWIDPLLAVWLALNVLVAVGVVYGN